MIIVKNVLVTQFVDGVILKSFIFKDANLDLTKNNSAQRKVFIIFPAIKSTAISKFLKVVTHFLGQKLDMSCKNKNNKKLRSTKFTSLKQMEYSIGVWKSKKSLKKKN